MNEVTKIRNQLKPLLEKAIFDVVSTFEDSTGVIVERINIERFDRVYVDGVNSILGSIKVDLKL